VNTRLGVAVPLCADWLDVPVACDP
jgi:hypothetical protein